MLMRGAYLNFHRRAQAHFRKHGVTADQYVLLAVLAEEENLTQKELTRRSYSDANTVTAMLNRLEEKGLVERRPCDRDKRAWRIHLTKRGRSLENILQKHAAPFHSNLEETLPSKHVDEISAWFKRVIVEMSSERTVSPRGSKRAPKPKQAERK
jgi:DNA-binding MarR family transcriptional regulator